MSHGSVVGRLSTLSRRELGVFRGRAALEVGVSRKQLCALVEGGVIVRVLPDTYRMTAVTCSSAQSLRAALLWAGDDAVASGDSAGETYAVEGVRAAMPEITVPRSSRKHARGVVVHRTDDRAALMVRRYHGVPVAGVEATLLALSHVLDGERFEVACEDARRRRLTSVPSLRRYLEQYGSGRPGSVHLRELLDELDPVHPSRSTLEVLTRRLLVASGMSDFVREFPLVWTSRTYRYDFGFEHRRTILETNGRRWHDDPADYEHDTEKWSVPGRLGYRIVFATWDKVTERPERLLAELTATLAA